MIQQHFSLPLILAGKACGHLHCTVEDADLVRIGYAQTPLSSPIPQTFLPFAEAVCAYGKGRAIQSWPLTFTLHGSPFFLKVWDALAQVPYGTTLSYTELARCAGRPQAIRAAARACATNPLPLIIPCHRVIAKDGGLGGFAWGIEIKRDLLALEQTALSHAAA